jgi:hypothetical protein
LMATFETDFRTSVGRLLEIMVCAAPLGPRYRGPIIAGKKTGVLASRLVDVAPSDTCVRFLYCKWPKPGKTVRILRLEV